MRNWNFLSGAFVLMGLALNVYAQSGSRSVFWMDQSFREIEGAGQSGGTVIAPMAQVEAHGPHLPVGTDFYIVNEIARRAAEASGAIVGPPILLGNCIDFASWPGYVIVDNATFLSIIKNYCESIAAHGFKRLIFLVEHGGANINGIQMAVEEYHRENPEMAILVTTTGMLLGQDVAKFRKPNFDLDTALMLAIKPEMVKMENLPEKLELNPRIRNAIPFIQGQSLADMAPDALFVLPTASTKEDGIDILDIVVRQLTELVGSRQ